MCVVTLVGYMHYKLFSCVCFGQIPPYFNWKGEALQEKILLGILFYCLLFLWSVCFCRAQLCVGELTEGNGKYQFISLVCTGAAVDLAFHFSLIKQRIICLGLGELIGIKLDAHSEFKADGTYPKRLPAYIFNVQAVNSFPISWWQPLC